jgi:hypothetical protein
MYHFLARVELGVKNVVGIQALQNGGWLNQVFE